MPQLPFRKSVNTEDSPDDQQQWTPPSYAQPSDDNSSKEWTPPSYATIANNKAPKTAHEKAKEQVTFTGSLKHSLDETKKKVDSFVNSTLADKSSHPYVKRLLTTQDPATESVLPTTHEMGMKEPDTYWGGFRKGLYDEFIRPVASFAGASGILGTDEAPDINEKPPIPNRPVAERPIGPTRPQNRALPPPSFIPLGKSSLESDISLESSIRQPVKPNFVNPFDKSIKDENGINIAPPQNTPVEVPNKAPGTEFEVPTPDAKGESIKRDILRDYTGEKFNEDAYNKIAKSLNMGIDKPTDWKAPDYAKSTEISTGKLSDITKQLGSNLDNEEMTDKLMSDARNIINKEKDLSTIQDHVNHLNELYESAKTRGSSDEIELLGQLRDEAIDKSKGYIPDENDQPLYAKSEQGGIKIGQNIEHSAEELTTGYTSELPAIMMREAFQNAKDAIDHLGDKGEIHVSVNKNGFSVHDNGKGMSRNELETVFSNLHESGKVSDTNATGGKGIGKATYILGGKHFAVSTVKEINGKKIQVSIGGTKSDFMKHVDVHEQEVPYSTPTGTEIKTKFTDEQKTKDADYFARDMYKNIINHSRDLNGKTTSDIHLDASKNNLIPIKQTLKDDDFIGETDIKENNIGVYIPKNQKLDKRSYINVHVLNNGMYQYTSELYLGDQIPDMGSDIVVNVKPSALERTPEYPFPTQRESLKSDIKKTLDEYIRDVVIEPRKRKLKSTTQELYDSMESKNIGGVRKSIVFDPGNRFTPDEKNIVKNSPIIQQVNKFFDRVVDEALKSTGRDKWYDKLEGVGTMFSEKGFYGVHIPNPTSGKSSILVNFLNWIEEHPDNPKQAAWNSVSTLFHEMGHIGERSFRGTNLELNPNEMNDPRIGEFMKMYLENVKHGGETTDHGHAADWLARTAEIMTKYGPSKTIGAVDELTNIFSKQSSFGVKFGGYNAETEKLLQLAKERGGRAETTTDYLSPTGVKSESPKGGEENTSGSTETNSERTSSSAVNKLFSALSDAKGKIQQQESINRAERAKRFGAFAKVKAEGAKGAAQSLSKLKGSFDKVDPGGAIGLSQKDTDILFTTIKKSNMTNGEKARGYTALFKLVNGDGVPVRSELAVLDDVFGNGFADKITELHGGIGIVGLKISKLANTMKTMQNSLSLAAPLRHGIGMISRKEFRPAFIDMFKMFADKDFYNASMKSIEEHPKYLQAREAGLFLPKMASGSDEEFLNSYIGNIPSGPKGLYVRNAADASKRSYTGFLNKLKFDTYNSMTEQAKTLGYKLFDGISDEDPTGTATKYAKGIANFINTFTGRGDLGRLNSITKELNMLLWSPRMMASRIQMFTSPKLYMDLPPQMRIEGLKSLFAIAALGTIIDTAASYAGAKVSTNILSTDFGKSRFGTQLIDPWGGFQQYVVGAARFLAGKTDGNIPTSRLEIAGRFLANKESPASGLAHTILTAKKFTGSGNFVSEYGQNTSIEGEVVRRFMPIFEQDLEALVSSNPGWSDSIGLKAAMSGASLTGMAQNYPEKKTRLSIGKMKLK